MLAISNKRYLISVTNIVVMKWNSIYYYIHRSLYDKLVILNHEYTYEAIKEKINPAHNGQSVEWFYHNAPAPIQILAPFIGVFKQSVNPSIKDCCGALHLISQLIDVLDYIKNPATYENRDTMDYLSADYELAWESFFMTAVPPQKKNTGLSDTDVEIKSKKDSTKEENENALTEEEKSELKELLTC